MGVASMKKWYFGVVLLAGWLGQAGTAGAQYLPTPYGAARYPEPVPCPTPNLVEGPISPQGAPPGPPCGVDLPADHNSAFQCEEFVRDEHAFASFGAVGLMRQKLGHQLVAVQDPQNLDTGAPPQGNRPTIQDLNDIGTTFQYGPKGSVGYLWQNCAVELAGFWIPNTSQSTDLVMPGRIDLPFRNPPLGFEGNNGLWLQADRVNSQFTSGLWGGELNFRYTNAGIGESELILGVRYLDLGESVRIFTGDDDVTHPDPFGNPDPTRQAFYQVNARNRIVAPQIGFECAFPCGHLVTFGAIGKAAVGADFTEVRAILTRGDGLVGFDARRTHTIPLTQIYELGAYADFNILERLRLRLGYNAMFVVDIAAAQDQINFDLSAPLGTVNNHGNAFYHGPVAELQFLF
jgi:hypothetical protein